MHLYRNKSRGWNVRKWNLIMRCMQFILIKLLLVAGTDLWKPVCPNRAGKSHFSVWTKCQLYRSNNSLINYTENLWTSKCHPKTLHLTGWCGGHEGTTLIPQRKTLFGSCGTWRKRHIHRRRTHSRSLQLWYTPIPKHNLKKAQSTSAAPYQPIAVTDLVTHFTFP